VSLMIDEKKRRTSGLVLGGKREWSHKLEARGHRRRPRLGPDVRKLPQSSGAEEEFPSEKRNVVRLPAAPSASEARERKIISGK